VWSGGRQRRHGVIVVLEDIVFSVDNVEGEGDVSVVVPIDDADALREIVVVVIHPRIIHGVPSPRYVRHRRRLEGRRLTAATAAAAAAAAAAATTTTTVGIQTLKQRR
jgi:hypothetical protein